jgi:hypothetical protein
VQNFYDHVSRKAAQGIPYEEACQLMLWIYCTLHYLPKEFQKLELTRANLALLFSKLSANGKIMINQRDDVSLSDTTRPQHWENLVDKLLDRKIVLDETFPERFGRYA